MTIETKFNTHDTVWLLSSNRVMSGTVCKIEITRTDHDTHEVYSVRMDDSKVHQFHVNYLFPSKQALLESL
jgi:hypothetical protein